MTFSYTGRVGEKFSVEIPLKIHWLEIVVGSLVFAVIITVLSPLLIAGWRWSREKELC